jgi:hypothetical protein
MLFAKANPATGDRGAQKEKTSWWDGPQNNRHARTSKAIRADLIGAGICTALGLAINSSSPVLALCRALIEAGHDPATPLEAIRRALCRDSQGRALGPIAEALDIIAGQS